MLSNNFVASMLHHTQGLQLYHGSVFCRSTSNVPVNQSCFHFIMHKQTTGHCCVKEQQFFAAHLDQEIHSYTPHTTALTQFITFAALTTKKPQWRNNEEKHRARALKGYSSRVKKNMKWCENRFCRPGIWDFTLERPTHQKRITVTSEVI